MTTEKDLQEVLVETDAHERLHCAITGTPYCAPAERKKLSVLVEAVRRGQPITEALLIEGRDPLPEDVHARLAAALRGEAYVPLPAGIHRRLAEALSPGSPAVSQDIYERLAAAVRG
jgi:hypothetical protein